MNGDVGTTFKRIGRNDFGRSLPEAAQAGSIERRFTTMPRWRNGRRSGLKSHFSEQQRGLESRQTAHLQGFFGIEQSVRYSSRPFDTQIRAKAEPKQGALRRAVLWLIHWIYSPLRRSKYLISLTVLSGFGSTLAHDGAEA
jgi:hypothetical protein